MEILNFAVVCRKQFLHRNVTGGKDEKKIKYIYKTVFHVFSKTASRGIESKTFQKPYFSIQRSKRKKENLFLQIFRFATVQYRKNGDFEDSDPKTGAHV